MYDMIIVGGGPAALSATLYAQGKKLRSVLLFEELGGKVGWLHSPEGLGADQYLPGNEVVQLLVTKATQQGRAVINDQALRIARSALGFRVETQDHGVLESTAVLIATGTTPLVLRVPGAERLVQHGLAYSITTYAHLVAGMRVAVVGVSKRALVGAMELAHGAAQLYLIVPDPRILDNPLGAKLRQSANVKVYEGYEVTEVLGTTAVEMVQIGCGSELQNLRVDRAFADLGLLPQTDAVCGLVETDARGFIVVNARRETTLAGVFAAGDVTTAPCEQVLVAIGDGARAAMSAYEYILVQGPDRTTPDAP